MADEIHVFSSTNSNSPVLTGETGKLIDLMTACLVNGYTAQSVTSITRSGTTATVTVSGGHGLSDGQWATIAGADQSDYNGRFLVTYVSSTAFTVQVANSPATPATGTITARRASAGWSLAFSGTNKAAYRSPNNASARHYLRVLDDASTTGGAKEAALRGYVSMSDVDTGSEPFPTVAQQGGSGLYVCKSTTANSTARSWAIFADDKTFYLFVASGGGTIAYGFGHFESYKAGDAFNSFIGAGANQNSGGSAPEVSNGIGNGVGLNAITYHGKGVIYVPRSYTQTGTAVAAGTFGQGNAVTTPSIAVHGNGGATNLGFSFAAPSSNADGALFTYPIYVMELVGPGTSVLRGRMPGLLAPAHANGTVSSGGTTSSVPGYTGRTFYHMGHDGLNTGATSASGQLMLDMTGPW